MAGWMTASAQDHHDTFVLSAGYSFAVGHDKIADPYAGYDYDEAFNKFDITASYEAFAWRGLFFMPQVSLWYSDNPHDYIIKKPMTNPDPQPDYGGHKAYQYGGTAATMVAWRFDLGQNFSLDVLTGPMLNLNFGSKVKGWNLVYRNRYCATTFDWRAGVALNIKSRLRVGANFDVRTGRQKVVQEEYQRIFFLPSGKKRCNGLNFSVGYRF